MDTYRTIVEILSATASLVAILTVLLSWYRSAQKALLIDRVVVHEKDDELKYILVVRNRKQYPVTIKSVGCYTKKTFEVPIKGVGDKRFSFVSDPFN